MSKIGYMQSQNVWRLGRLMDNSIVGRVVAVSAAATHTFSKTGQRTIRLLEGLGVEGDAHSGKTVKHRSRVRADPTQPNLRQVHLIHQELLEELVAKGFEVGPGALGENILTRGVDLLALPTDTVLKIGEEAEVRVTGLRNPCKQIDDYQKGLLSAVLGRDPSGQLIRKAGIMGVVRRGGLVGPNDGIEAKLPAGLHRHLEPV